MCCGKQFLSYSQGIFDLAESKIPMNMYPAEAFYLLEDKK